ncbi:hypothetical protein BD560DRAFT_370907 [Blakeslea trispora]|nr:hypothetical protein BD560DRAFT_370907 [Blakeslea trispora]
MIRVLNKPTINLIQREHQLFLRKNTHLNQAIRPFAVSSSTRNTQSDGLHKVYALPFKLPEEKVHQIVNIASYVNRHAFFGILKILKSIFTRKMPEVSESVTSMQVRKAYIPFWYYDIAISADVTHSSKNENDSSDVILKTMGPVRQILGMSQNCFWPGHSWDPVCYLSLANTLHLKDLVPFSPDLYQEREDIEVLPFTVNPLEDIVERAPNALENLSLDSPTHKSGISTLNNAKVLFSSAYPIYWPVYIAQFTEEGKEEDKPKTVVIGAHSNDPPLYQWDMNKKGAEQWINNGRWIGLDVTEIEWQVGFSTQPPVRHLEHRFLTEVVGHFQTNKSIDWSDERIQAYPIYQDQNKKYLIQLFKVWFEQNMLARGFVESKEDEKFRIQMKTGGLIRNDIENRVRNELARLKELEPTWYKEYIKKRNQQ